jgi:hypothetical protein
MRLANENDKRSGESAFGFLRETLLDDHLRALGRVTWS